MKTDNEQTENLFSYGTLQQEEVQLAAFGRRLAGVADTLLGYKVTLIPIQDRAVIANTGDTHYRNVQFTGVESDCVSGTVFRVTKSELEQADEYERDADYKRVTVTLKSGVTSWVYLNLRHES
jgi:gamma-glutamylcyclotransferase (GGCT)/AIG2-like uncharacterized protein YtfP